MAGPDIGSLLAGRRTVKITIAADAADEPVEATVVYNPSKWTTEWDQSRRGGDSIVDYLERLVVEWDLTADGEPVPPTVEGMSPHPPILWRLIWVEIERDFMLGKLLSTAGGSRLTPVA